MSRNLRATDGLTYTFHAPLSRSACEALGRATASRLGRRFGRDLALTVADLGWSLRMPEGATLDTNQVESLLEINDFESDILDGLDRGELMARRFRHVAATALLVLRNPEGGRRKVGGLLWVSHRLHPMMKTLCPDHPLLRETRREVLEDVLDAPAACAWLRSNPVVRVRKLAAPSPFASAWIDASEADGLAFESPAEAPPAVACAGWRRAAPESRHERGITVSRTRWLDACSRRRGRVAGAKVAVVADVHLGYEWARGRGGDCIPAHSLAETIVKLTSLLGRSALERLIVAGDLVESSRFCRRTNQDVSDLTRWLSERGVSLEVLAGNHDPPRDPPTQASCVVNDWTIAHGHEPIDALRTIRGHHHPALRAVGVSAPCFLVSESAIVLPAFSPNAAGVGLATVARALGINGLKCVAVAGNDWLDFGPLELLIHERGVPPRRRNAASRQHHRN